MTKYQDSENNWTTGVHLHLTGAIYMYRGNIPGQYHNIQTSSPLKPFGLSILYETSIGTRKLCMFKNPGHVTKMAAMPITPFENLLLWNQRIDLKTRYVSLMTKLYYNVYIHLIDGIIYLFCMVVNLCHLSHE